MLICIMVPYKPDFHLSQGNLRLQTVGPNFHEIVPFSDSGHFVKKICPDDFD